MATVTIVATNTVTNTVLDDVTIQIYSGASLVTSGVTGEAANPDGTRIFTLANGTYTMRISYASPGYVVASPQSFTVDGDATFDIDVEVTARPVSPSSSLCRCSGYVVNASGAVLRGATYGLILVQGPLVLGTAAVYNKKLQLVTDSAGYAQIDLIRGAMYRVTYGAHETIEAFVVVPALSSANLADVLHPVVTSVSFSPSAVSVSVGESEDVAVTLHYRSGLTRLLSSLSDYEELPVTFEAGDSDATVAVTDGVLVVTGVAAGTCTITATRVTDEDESAPDVVYGLSALTGSLVVTVS